MKEKQKERKNEAGREWPHNQNPLHENRMGVLPVRSLLLTMGIPMILSMMLQAFYNIVDSAFVSNISGDGELALNALTLAFPVQMLMVALGIGTGVGVNALLAKSLGQGDREKANQTAGNGILLSVIICAFCFGFGIFGVDAYINTQTSNVRIADMAADYLRICCILSFGMIFFATFEKLLQATGHSIHAVIAQVAGALTNIILDPIMIYGLFGCPAFGVQGAAYATVIGQIVSFIIAVLFHLKVNKEIENKIYYMKPVAGIIREIYTIGIPAIIAQALMSFMTYGLNIIFGKLDETVVTAYGLFYKIQQFILFAAFGLRDAITPVVSFNHGMRSRQRVKDGIKYGMLYTLLLMLAGMLVLEVFAVPLSGIFGLSGETRQLCIDAMHIISVSFIFAGANVAFQGIFQALEGGLESLVVSICRQCIFVLPVACFFTQIVRQSGAQARLIWLTFPIAEILSALIAILFMVHVNKKKIRVLV